MLGVEDAFGFSLPVAKHLLDEAMVVDGSTQDLGLLGRDVAMRGGVASHASPLVIRAVARGRIGRADAVRLSALHHALDERAGAEKLYARDSLA